MFRTPRVRASDQRHLAGRGPHDGSRWPVWAAANGWSYQPVDPALSGVYAPVPPGDAATCFNILRSTVNRRPVLAFESAFYRHGTSNQEVDTGLVALLVIALPGLPPADVVEHGLERAMLRLGGAIPSGASVYLHGSDLVSLRRHALTPEHLSGDAELLTRQINAMPASFWRAAH